MRTGIPRGLILLALASACRARAPEAAATAPAEPAVAVAVPVRVATVSRLALTEEVAASGHTAALAQEKIRAPFAGTLTELAVTDGDRVRRGDVLGTVASRDSEAALAGARDMQRQASTDAEKVDAARALALAQSGLVRSSILAPSDGTVLSHAAVRGDRVTEDQEILTIADAASVAFLVDVAQSDLSRIRPGQTVSVEIAGRPARLSGTVHDVLPGANAADYTAAVRVDLRGVEGVPPLGLFGTARITVAEHRDATVVPESAVLRDDVTGTSRLVLVEQGRARWLDVEPGMRSNGRVEIKAPPLDVGKIVVISGQVGLAEGSPVAAAP
jgi:multidrug efflux pump subunit AcrA (membrane-fusion protein)